MFHGSVNVCLLKLGWYRVDLESYWVRWESTHLTQSDTMCSKHLLHLLQQQQPQQQQKCRNWVRYVQMVNECVWERVRACLGEWHWQEGSRPTWDEIFLADGSGTTSEPCEAARVHDLQILPGYLKPVDNGKLIKKKTTNIHARARTHAHTKVHNWTHKKDKQFERERGEY